MSLLTRTGADQVAPPSAECMRNASDPSAPGGLLAYTMYTCPLAGFTSILGKEFARKPPFRVPVANPIGVTAAAKTGGAKLAPPSVDLATMMPGIPGASLSHVTYTSPPGPTAG